MRDFSTLKSSFLLPSNGVEPSHEEIAKAVGVGLAEYESVLQRLEATKLTSIYCNRKEQMMDDEMSQIPSRDESVYDAWPSIGILHLQFHAPACDHSVNKDRTSAIRPRWRL